MSYQDYSSQFVLDQFLTYLNVNQLGANDQHLYNTIDVEHNINTSTVDGTHKANSILGSYINKNPVSASSWTLSGGTFWLPTAGVYQLNNAFGQDFIFEMYVSGSWVGPTGSAKILGGIYFFDGTNMRINVGGGGGGGTLTLYYQKF